MNRLTYIANKHNADKGTTFSYAHGFTEFYYSFFQKIAEECYKENRKVNALEIGVGDFAGGIHMLNEFFDGNCEIYGLDINPSYLQHSTENIHIDMCDQGNRNAIINFLNKIGNTKFDIIIDDGSHEIEHQLISLAYFHKALSKNGIYIIEDLHTSISDEWCNPTESTIYSLAFKKHSMFLTEEENRELEQNIKTFLLYSRQNKNNDDFNNTSITSIITFNNNEF